MLAQWKWRFITDNGALWRRFIVTKYGSVLMVGGPIVVEVLLDVASVDGSNKDWTTFLISVKFVVGNRKEIKFLYDHWIDEMPLEAVFHNIFDIVSFKEGKVMRCIVVESVGTFLSPKISLIGRLMGCSLLSQLENMPLSPYWQIFVSGKSSIKMRYNHHHEDKNVRPFSMQTSTENQILTLHRFLLLGRQSWYRILTLDNVRREGANGCLYAWKRRTPLIIFFIGVLRLEDYGI